MLGVFFVNRLEHMYIQLHGHGGIINAHLQ